MAHNYEGTLDFAPAPAWSEQSRPHHPLANIVPAIILVRIPDEAFWSVASRAETDVIADPGSYLGRLMRPHAALLALPYISNN